MRISIPILLLSAWLSFPIKAQTNFTVSTASYVGDTSSGNQWRAIDVAPDGTIVAGGALPGSNPGGITPVSLLGGGNGVIVRFDKTGTKVLSVTRVGQAIYDMEIAANGNIAITGTFGVGVLKPDAGSFVWADTTIKKGTIWGHTKAFFGNGNGGTYSYDNMNYRRSVSRVAIGTDGSVVTMQVPIKYFDENNNNALVPPPYAFIYLYDSTGKLLNYKTLNDKYVEDITIDGANKNYIVGGWNPLMTSSNIPIHMPFMYCFDYKGNLNWQNYNWTADQVFSINITADSRVNELTIGKDGYLYMAGYIHGGDYVWKLGPEIYTNTVNVDIGYDVYSQAYSMGPGTDQAYFAQYDPKTGNILKGQPLLVRSSPSGTGSSIVNSAVPAISMIKAITADTDGTVFLAGYCQAYIKNRSGCEINGVPVSPNDNTISANTNNRDSRIEAFLTVVAPDWQSKKVWTVFSGDSSISAAWAIGMSNGTAAMAGEVFSGKMVASSNAINTTGSGNRSGYLVAWDYASAVTALKSQVESSFPFIVVGGPTGISITPKNAKAYNYQLFTSDGRLMAKSGATGFQQISITLPSLYLLQITSETGNRTVKVLAGF